MTTLVPPGPYVDQRHTSPNTRFEWQITAIADGATVADVRGICRRYTCATRHIEAELAGAPGDADAYGTVRGLTVTPTPTTAADGAYQRWDRQAVAVRAADGAVTWMRDRVVDTPAESAGGEGMRARAALAVLAVAGLAMLLGGCEGARFPASSPSPSLLPPLADFWVAGDGFDGTVSPDGAVPGDLLTVPLAGGQGHYPYLTHPYATSYQVTAHLEGGGHLVCVVVLGRYSAAAQSWGDCTARLVPDGHGGWRAGG